MPTAAAAALSRRGPAFAGDTALPLVGRVSMDTITFDVTDAPDGASRAASVELIGPRQTVDDLAAAAGTIGYEILTSLGGRYHRVS